MRLTYQQLYDFNQIMQANKPGDFELLGHRIGYRIGYRGGYFVVYELDILRNTYHFEPGQVLQISYGGFSIMPGHEAEATYETKDTEPGFGEVCGSVGPEPPTATYGDVQAAHRGLASMSYVRYRIGDTVHFVRVYPDKNGNFSVKLPAGATAKHVVL